MIAISISITLLLFGLDGKPTFFRTFLGGMGSSALQLVSLSRLRDKIRVNRFVRFAQRGFVSIMVYH